MQQFCIAELTQNLYKMADVQNAGDAKSDTSSDQVSILSLS